MRIGGVHVGSAEAAVSSLEHHPRARTHQLPFHLRQRRNKIHDGEDDGHNDGDADTDGGDGLRIYALHIDSCIGTDQRSRDSYGAGMRDTSSSTLSIAETAAWERSKLNMLQYYSY